MNTFSVSELNRQVRGELEAVFGDVWVEGELSNLACPASGHLYFSLKDSNAQISCALFKGSRFGLKLPIREIANGLLVRAHGRVSLYEPRGNYQLIVDQLEPAGLGALEQAFKARQAELAAEGLFDMARKQAIPTQPRTIGLITSASGAAVHDALTTLKRRNPLIPIIIYPSMVQGEQAPAQLIAQINTANARAECDVLLIIRGGGSLEDLWAFNDPDLVRSIVASQIPIISGIGHEVDVTLADLAADLRAPTPTAAAEQAVPVLSDIIAQKDSRLKLIQQRFQRHVQHKNEMLRHISQRLMVQNPTRRLQMQNQRCDELNQRLTQATQRLLNQKKVAFTALSQRLNPATIMRTIQRDRLTLQSSEQRLSHSVLKQNKQRRAQLNHLMQSLHNLSPLNVLDRGYAMAFDEHKHLIRHSQDVAAGARIQVKLGSGKLHCDVVRRSKT